MKKRKLEYKPLLYTTTIRNPERIKSLLFILKKFDSQVLDDALAIKIVSETIKYGLYRPQKQSLSIKNKWKSTANGLFAKKLLTDDELKYIIEHNHQQHKEAGFAKGFPSRFATLFDLAKELGFVYFKCGEKIEFSEIGSQLANVYDVTVDNDGGITTTVLHPEYEQRAFLQAMAKSQRKNPFVRVLNDNIPLILLLQTIKKLNENPELNTSKGESKGISRRELPLLIFWKDNNSEALYQRIVKLRNDYGYNPSDEIICDICTKEIQGGFKQFKMKSIMDEYPDEFIRKMRITGLISLRGAGRFIDINYNEEARINYILEHYANYKTYTDEREYFNYMAEIDNNLFDIQAKTITTRQSEALLSKWVSVYSWDKLKKELINLSNRTQSKDFVLKFLSAPVRLEFLIALSIKSKLPDVRVIPNYCCDDTGLPTSTAGGGISDIECYEQTHGIIVEVTMAEGRTQTIMEIWPIARHLEEFSNKTNLKSQAVFVAPSIFSDSQSQIDYVKTVRGYWIRPYKIAEFIEFLENNSSLYVNQCQ